MHRVWWQRIGRISSVLLVGVVTGCGETAVTAPELPGDINYSPEFVGQDLFADHDLIFEDTVAVWDRDGDSVTVTAVTLRDGSVPCGSCARSWDLPRLTVDGARNLSPVANSRCRPR